MPAAPSVLAAWGWHQKCAPPCKPRATLGLPTRRCRRRRRRHARRLPSPRNSPLHGCCPLGPEMDRTAESPTPSLGAFAGAGGACHPARRRRGARGRDGQRQDACLSGTPAGLGAAQQAGGSGSRRGQRAAAGAAAWRAAARRPPAPPAAAHRHPGALPQRRAVRASGLRCGGPQGCLHRRAAGGRCPRLLPVAAAAAAARRSCDHPRGAGVSDGQCGAGLRL